MSEDAEIVRRLALLDRKLNYLSGIVISMASVAGAGIVYFGVRSWAGDSWGFFAAAAAWIVFQIAFDKPFRRADP